MRWWPRWQQLPSGWCADDSGARRVRAVAADGPFLDLLGPVYVREDAKGLVVGLRVQDKHLNARGRLHGAVVCALADVALGRSLAATAGEDVVPVTASLQVQFLGSAAGGDWVEATAVVNRAGRRMGFVDGTVRAGEQLIATATAVFAMGRIS